MEVIGLTGGIAAGKSAVAARLAAHGAVVIDADRLAREAVEPGSPGLAAVVDRFGEGMLTPDGSLDRSQLGTLIFGDEQARLALNAIVHPEVRRLYREQVEEAFAANPDAIVVYDVPLLAEARAADEFALVVVVDAPPEVRLERLVSLRGLPREQAEARIRSQISDEERRAMADVVIDAGGTLEHTLEQVDALWERLVAQRAVGGRS